MQSFAAMNAETGSFDRCVKHPSRISAGFCSACLIERLSNVDSAEKTRNMSCDTRSECIEIFEISPMTHRNSGGGRQRETLLSLFELDDLNGSEKTGPSRKSEPLNALSTVLFWLHSKLLIRRLKSKSRDNVKKARLQERCGDFMNDRVPSQVSWENPRHSWDGSLMSKALTCSFSCLEEQQNVSFKIKDAPLPDESATSGSKRFGEDDNGVLSDHFRDFRNDNNDPKKSNGWIRACNWIMTSPFSDFAKRSGHALERSLSESWREDRNGIHSGNLHSNRSLNYSYRNGEKPERKKMRDSKLCRSQSVHYTSPRNLDNGLLRFYLTPLRTSRRGMTKCRRRTSHPLAGGFFGI